MDDDNIDMENNENLNPDDVPQDEDGQLKDEGPKEPQNRLKPDLLKKSLKKLSKTYNGLSYAYIELDLKEKELDDIGEELNNYIHLRDINISNNKFPHISPIQNMTYLVRLDGSKNEIKDLEIFTNPEKLQFLQILNLKENKIRELPRFNTKSLTELNLETNLIDNCINYTGLPNLTKLNLNQNKLKTCEGLANMPLLKVIYLNENNIKSLKGLENLDNLRKLRLKNNKIENLINEFIPFLPSLEKLNISENKIKEVKQFSALKFTKLNKINVEGNPYFEEANAGAKIEILIQLEDLKIKSVNKEEVTVEDRDQSKTVKEERIQKDKEEAEEKERVRIQEEKEKLDREEEEKKQKEIEDQERRQKEEEERLEREAELERQRQEKLASGEDMENIEKVEGENIDDQNMDADNEIIDE